MQFNLPDNEQVDEWRESAVTRELRNQARDKVAKSFAYLLAVCSESTDPRVSAARMAYFNALALQEVLEPKEGNDAVDG